MKSTMILGLVILVVAIVVAGPIFTIMSLNHLFNTGIEITFWSWLATFWLQLLVYGSTAKVKS